MSHSIIVSTGWPTAWFLATAIHSYIVNNLVYMFYILHMLLVCCMCENIMNDKWTICLDVFTQTDSNNAENWPLLEGHWYFPYHLLPSTAISVRCPPRLWTSLLVLEPLTCTSDRSGMAPGPTPLSALQTLLGTSPSSRPTSAPRTSFPSPVSPSFSFLIPWSGGPIMRARLKVGLRAPHTRSTPTTTGWV